VRRPVTIAPAVVDSCVSEAPPKPDPGFVVTAPQAPRRWLPGCAGNVVPGAPASAYADVADAAKSVRLAMPIAIARRIAHLPAHPHASEEAELIVGSFASTDRSATPPKRETPINIG